MRRNMDLLRLLLLKLEEMERPHGFAGLSSHDPNFAFEGFTPDDVDAHMGMLYDADYIQSGTNVRGPMNGDWYFKSLTWEGRDFLDTVRQQETWTKTKGILNNAGGWTVKMAAEVAKQIIKGELLKHGVPIA